jgi:protein-disulfide isomerase
MGNTLMAMTKKTLAVTALAGVLLVGGTGVVLAQWWGGREEKPAVSADAAQAAATTVAAQSYDVSGLQANPLQIQNWDRVMGSMSAPVTFIEYASMTCSHCAEFHQKAIPQLIKEYVETGKVKYVLRDMAWDNMALGMAKLARCAPANQYYPLVKDLFDNQMAIVTSRNPKGEIERVASGYGMDAAKVEACVKDQPLHGLVLAMKDSAMKGLGVQGTPTSFVNGTKIDGGLPWKDVKAVVDAELAKAGAQ